MLPDYSDPITLASTFNMYFIEKIANIRAEFPLLESSIPPYLFGSMNSIMPFFHFYDLLNVVSIF